MGPHDHVWVLPRHDRRQAPRLRRADRPGRRRPGLAWVAFIIIGREHLIMGLRGSSRPRARCWRRRSGASSRRTSSSWPSCSRSSALDEPLGPLLSRRVGDARRGRDYRVVRCRVPGPFGCSALSAGELTQPAFVTGGTGFLGGAIVARLLADGREVKALAGSATRHARSSRWARTPFAATCSTPRTLRPRCAAARSSTTPPASMRSASGTPPRCSTSTSRLAQRRGRRGGGGRSAGRVHVVGRRARRGPRDGGIEDLATPRLVPLELRALEVRG